MSENSSKPRTSAALSVEELGKLVRIMRAEGIMELHTGDIRIVLGPMPQPMVGYVPPAPEEAKRTAERQRKYEDDLLYAHTEGFPDPE